MLPWIDPYLKVVLSFRAIPIPECSQGRESTRSKDKAVIMVCYFYYRILETVKMERKWNLNVRL